MDSSFLLSKASPGAYSTYRNAILSIALFIYAYVDCALRIGLLDDGNRLHGSTFRILPFYRCIYLYQLDVLCVVDSHHRSRVVGPTRI
jgi:hypothetical protein